jgi:hypothetical protein
MKHVRIDGSGMNHEDQRMKNLSNFVKESKLIDENKIDILIDRKGHLYVHWNKSPNDHEKMYVDTLWNYFNEYEITHYLVLKTIQEI